MDFTGVAIVLLSLFVAFVYPRISMKKAVKQSCSALAMAVAHREPYLSSHSERTAKLVVNMAKMSMRIWPWRIWDLEMAALLHMIGKVGVSYSILNDKQAPEGQALFELREYVRIGAEMLSASPTLRRASWIVAFHREYYDGGGYPYGRYGDNIPFESRLLCVASEFVAMTSQRIYREGEAPFSPEEAMQHFVEYAGERYDPESVALLNRACQKMGIIKRKKRAANLKASVFRRPVA